MKKAWIIAAFILVGAWLGARYYPLSKTTVDTPGFVSLRDDALAGKYAPVLEPAEHGEPMALYYRAARDTMGRRHITYHFVWPYERNNASGLGPLMNRTLYTGGLSLQRTMYGRGDIEMVSLVLGESGDVIDLSYETAANYDPHKFGVEHAMIHDPGPVKLPLLFRVISWNHLFKRLPTGAPKDGTDEKRTALRPQYFTRELWDAYEMWKPVETALKKSRAHQTYERTAAD